jgi:hypothetical protein
MIRPGRELEEVFAVLDRLHRPKDRAYGDAWRKRGEILGIFVNIARKFDRLSVALTELANPGTESLGDTVADLTVYAGKYVTWLAEMHPEAFDAVGLSRPAASCASKVGPDSLTEVFALVAAGEALPSTVPMDVPAAASEVSAAFEEMEGALTAQADGASALPAGEKLSMALRLTWSSGWLLVRLAQQDPSIWEELQRTVAAMEQGS